MAVLQSNSVKVGSLFFAILGVSVILLVNLGMVILVALKKWPKKNLSTRLAIRYLHRQKTHAISCFLALSLGALLINLIPQIRQSILSELKQPSGIQLPSLFLFDIQQDQKDPFKTFVSNKDMKLSSLSPMIPGRLLAVKGEQIEAEDDQKLFLEKSRSISELGVGSQFKLQGRYDTSSRTGRRRGILWFLSVG